MTITFRLWIWWWGNEVTERTYPPNVTKWKIFRSLGQETLDPFRESCFFFKRGIEHDNRDAVGGYDFARWFFKGRGKFRNHCLPKNTTPSKLQHIAISHTPRQSPYTIMKGISLYSLLVKVPKVCWKNLRTTVEVGRSIHHLKSSHTRSRRDEKEQRNWFIHFCGLQTWRFLGAIFIHRKGMHPEGNIYKTFQTSQVFHKLVPNPSVPLKFLKKKIRCKTYKFCKHFTELLVSKNGCRVSSFHQQPRFSHTPHAVSQEAEKLALCLVRTLGSFAWNPKQPFINV